MNASQKLQHLIATTAAKWEKISFPEFSNDEEFDEAYDLFCDNYEDSIQDAGSEIRCSGVETGLACESSRHYESDAVAVQTPDGSWIGFTYWYGGGKHSDPESIEWIEGAYYLDVTEEERVQVVRTFTKKEDSKS